MKIGTEIIIIEGDHKGETGIISEVIEYESGYNSYEITLEDTDIIGRYVWKEEYEIVDFKQYNRDILIDKILK